MKAPFISSITISTLNYYFSYSYSPKPSPYYELPIPSLIESLDVVIHQAQLTNIQLKVALHGILHDV